MFTEDFKVGNLIQRYWAGWAVSPGEIVNGLYLVVEVIDEGHWVQVRYLNVLRLETDNWFFKTKKEYPGFTLVA